MKERYYQGRLINKLENLFPGCVVLKNDANYIQGIPDLIILYNDRWACLEVKNDSTSQVQPNQDYYIERLNEMSFAAYIYPENEAEVLDALQRSFESSW